MRILYIALCDLWANGGIGVKNKVFSQLKSLENNNETYLVTLKDMILCTFKYNELIDKNVVLSIQSIYGYIEEFVERQEIKMIFLRYSQTNVWLNKFLKNMKRKNKVVVIDFPTVPYDEEIKGRVELEEDKAYRGGLKKYVEYSTNYNGLDTVFGIPSIKFHNGINLEDIPLKKETESKDIRLIAVATMYFWHGYDRLIRGMADYYNIEPGGQKVYLTLVGCGKEVPRYEDLIRENRLEKYIKLVGIKKDEALSKEFDNADIAVGALGMFRKNMKEDSSIKTKEYCARGIPMVIGSNDLAFREELEFIYRVPNNNDNIDIYGILDFYAKYYKTGNKNMIRNYAEKYLTWDIQFERLFAKININ